MSSEVVQNQQIDQNIDQNIEQINSIIESSKTYQINSVGHKSLDSKYSKMKFVQFDNIKQIKDAIYWENWGKMSNIKNHLQTKDGFTIYPNILLFEYTSSKIIATLCVIRMKRFDEKSFFFEKRNLGTFSMKLEGSNLFDLYSKDYGLLKDIEFSSVFKNDNINFIAQKIKEAIKDKGIIINHYDFKTNYFGVKNADFIIDNFLKIDKSDLQKKEIMNIISEINEKEKINNEGVYQ